MDSTGVIAEKYTILVANEDVRWLFSLVKGDQAKETINPKETWKSVNANVVITDDNVKKAMFSARGWLEQVAYNSASLSNVFWWNMHFRIEKLLALMMALERKNYKSIMRDEEIEPNITDLPSYFVIIRRKLSDLNASGVYENLKIQHTSYVKQDRGFFGVYLGDFE